MSNKAGIFWLLLSLAPWHNAMATPAWIEQASTPGPDVALIGQSRFDQIFLHQEDGYQIPYPFSRLIETLESGLDNGDKSGVRQVFVPIGRSLQRDTPAPDYFRFPREVIALEGEPVTTGIEAGLVMEYRLFIAHQPRTETLEVISYNDAAGRFEFQVVENYAANGRPRVRPANRLMCMSCHHNGAPIFPGTPWSETSFNVEVAKRLVAALPDQFVSLIGVVTLDAGVIDVLIERANYLSATQILWQRGCGSPACRAAMLRAALQYRLSGESSFDQNSTSYRRDYHDELSRNWERNWPRGLALPGSRLDDRNPFAIDVISRKHDPLLPRPAQATWHQADTILVRGIIYRLAGFFTYADIRRLDQRLITLSNRNSPQSYRHVASCLARLEKPGIYRLRCGENSGPDKLQAEFRIEISGDRIDSLRVVSLKIPHDSNLLQPDIVELSEFADMLEAKIANDGSRLSQRLASGDRIDSIRLTWGNSLLAGESSLEIEISAESEFIDSALRQLLANHQTGVDNSLSSDVFQRKSVLRELMQVLGMETLEWRPTGRSKALEQAPPVTGLSDGLALLEPYCGRCHANATLHPPGFLAGSSPVDQILQCAPRILTRLKAWQRGNSFPRAPMPPPASIEFSGTSAADWPSSDHYHTLLASLEQLVAGKRQLGDWQNTNYDRLPPCLVRVNQ